MMPIAADFAVLDIANLFANHPSLSKDPQCPHTEGDPVYRYIDFGYDNAPPPFAVPEILRVMPLADEQLGVSDSGSYTLRFLLYDPVPWSNRLFANHPHVDDSFATWVLWSSTGESPKFYWGWFAPEPTPHRYRAFHGIARSLAVLFYKK